MNKNDNIQWLTKKILKITVEIQKKFPELYDLLNETPLFLSDRKRKITIEDFRQYLLSIRMQQKTFEKNSRINI
ncbi:hypothetical protein BCF58_1175 [Chryseobacterium defluvii]|uniref:Uncharacterized protein n=1 Tax=Chryseobacterium defluvii TaxID=160396 RepID=A0A495SPE4_9FLAO|nr:hypothetical protein BCF58_1175 [Chryseobacterium defluvii]